MGKYSKNVMLLLDVSFGKWVPHLACAHLPPIRFFYFLLHHYSYVLEESLCPIIYGLYLLVGFLFPKHPIYDLHLYLIIVTLYI